MTSSVIGRAMLVVLGHSSMVPNCSAAGGGDEVAETKDDHTETDGGEETSDSIDPIEPPFQPVYQCPDVPAVPREVPLWPAPSSLGNGLVHDTRLGLDPVPYSTPVLAEDLASGVAWAGWVEGHDRMTEVGFRPAQVQARVRLDSTNLEITDQTVYVADDDANHRTEIATYLFDDVEAEQDHPVFLPQLQGARPTSIDTFTVADGTKVGFSLAWVYDDADVDWRVVVGKSEPAMSAELEQLAMQGYRPIALSSRMRGRFVDHAAIVIRDGTKPSDWAVTLGLDAASFESEFQARWVEGSYPFLVAARQGAESYLDVLWIRRSPGLTVQMAFDVDSDAFMQADASWRSRGHHLESVASFDTAGQRRHFAIWVRYEPYMRWRGTKFDSNDAIYAQRHAMFHDQAIRQMSFATDIDCSDGRSCPSGTTCFECPEDDGACMETAMCVQPEQYRKVLRPSGTLHVFEGESLVLSRAYTFAPAIYPNTPLDVPMKLASVSKSITAAAVVREMHARSIPLTESFVTAADLSGTPDSLQEVSVLDTLRALGGFRAESHPYDNHWVIDDSPLGEIPISGEEVLDHAVLGGHLDDYWDADQYQWSRVTGEMVYSNVGFTVLGELVRLSSGQSYEDYVAEHLLAPLGLEARFFGDPGHRRCHPGVTLAGKRAYLVNGDHPYAIESPAPVSPRFGSQPLPRPSKGDVSMVWAANAGPIDPAAPDFASVGRYSGNAFMGGAPLAAGGWYADGEALGILIRELSQTSRLMPTAVSGQLWSPQWWNTLGSPAPDWSYGLGWYVRGNWVAWAGGADGSMATVLHNRVHDFTVVFLTNTAGNGLDEFMNPLMKSGAVEAVFPCHDEPATPEDECDERQKVPH